LNHQDTLRGHATTSLLSGDDKRKRSVDTVRIYFKSCN
jgi:hypothetical protein